MIKHMEDLGLPIDYARRIDVYLKDQNQYMPVGEIISGIILRTPISQAIKETKTINYM
jgi:hypothetical protein